MAHTDEEIIRTLVNVQIILVHNMWKNENMIPVNTNIRTKKLSCGQGCSSFSFELLMGMQGDGTVADCALDKAS